MSEAGTNEAIDAIAEAIRALDVEKILDEDALAVVALNALRALRVEQRMEALGMVEAPYEWDQISWVEADSG